MSNKEQLEALNELKTKIHQLSDEEKRKRNLYLKGLATGDIQGPILGYPSIDKTWLKYQDDKAMNLDIIYKSMYQVIKDNNKDNLDSVAIEYFGNKITYKEMLKKIEETAKSLKKIGVEEGDIVTMAVPSTPEVVYLFYALNKIGAISNMVDPRTSEEGIIDYTNETKSKLFIAIDMCYEKIKNISEKTNVENIITVSPEDSLPFSAKLIYKLANKSKVEESDSTMKWKRFLKLGNNEKNVESVYKKNTPAAILHTGGTTGVPKGVMLTNENFNSIADQYKNSGLDLQKEHKFMDIMPPFIAYGIGCGIHMPFMIGMRTLIIPKFEPEKFDSLLLKNKPNHMAGVPSHWENMVNSKKIKDKDLSFLKTPAVGGDSMNKKLEKETNQFLNEHNAPDIIKGYGLTEECSLATACLNDVNEIGSVGIPLPGNNVSIFDPDTNEEKRFDELGEICISSPTIMAGYYDNDIATKEMIKTHQDGSRWIHTKDVGYINKDGLLFVNGRIKRVIIRHDGFKVFPFQIEECISKHPSVSNCVVVGIPDINHKQGKKPKAHIVFKENNLDEEKLIAEINEMCKEQLPEYAVPIQYKGRKNLPLTNIGKVDYKELEKEDKYLEEERNSQKTR